MHSFDVDPGDNSYFLANESCFFHRFADSGFRNKWTGFWSDELKYLEYFAVKVNGEFLSPSSCVGLKYDGAKAVHEYEIDGATVTETLYIPNRGSALVVEMESDREMNVEIELAINIRKRIENTTSREYHIRPSGNGFVAANPLGRLEFQVIEGKGRFSRGVERRTHSPSGEEQNFIIPGTITASGNRVTFAISAGSMPSVSRRSLMEKEEFYSRLVNGKIKSNSSCLERGFEWSVIGTELMRKKLGKISCYYAGLPWFQQFWGRDLFWMVPSLLSLGYFREVRECLKVFAEKSDGGRIPNFISFREKSSWNSIDASLLWVTSLESYVSVSGDLEFLTAMRKHLLKTITYLFGRDADNDGFLEHDQGLGETWMDTLKRNDKTVEIQALYYKSLRAAESMLRLMGSKDVEVLDSVVKRATVVRDLLDKVFYDKGFYIDRVSGEGRIGIETANALVPLICGFRDHAGSVLRRIESRRFTTDVGVRTRAEGESGYMPWGYHTGMVWSLTTAWASAAEFACGRPGRGWKYMKMLIDDMDEDALGCISECWNGESLDLGGCSLQLWGSGFIPRLVDEFMLGIRVDATKKVIHVSPRLPKKISHVEREIIIGTKKVKLSFRRKGSSASVKCNDPSMKLVKE